MLNVSDNTLMSSCEVYVIQPSTEILVDDHIADIVRAWAWVSFVAQNLIRYQTSQASFHTRIQSLDIGEFFKGLVNKQDTCFNLRSVKYD